MPLESVEGRLAVVPDLCANPAAAPDLASFNAGSPVIDIANGLNNQLMILRACVLFDPMTPGSGLGKALPKESEGAYALVATSSYVMEPFQ